LFTQLPCNNNVVGLDSLCILARFAREAITGKNKVMVHGVCRKEACQIPACVFQKEVKKNEQAAVRGKTKAAVLEGHPECKEMVAFSVYDTKPVHFLSTTCTNMCWKEIWMKVYDKDSGINVVIKFLHTNMQDSYNHIMNLIGPADQLRGNYQMDKWTRNRKWWWAIWMWGLETLLVNAFVLYRETHQLVWKTQKKKMFTHFQFCKAVALSWLTGKKASSELNQLMNVWKRSTNSVLTFTNSLSTGPVKKRHVLSMKPPLILKRVH